MLPSVLGKTFKFYKEVYISSFSVKSFVQLRPLQIFLLGLLSILLVGFIDGEATYYFWKAPHLGYSEWMAQSLFETGKFGGSDFGIFLGIFALIYWMVLIRKGFPKNHSKVLKLKFIFLSVILAPLFAVHSFKWIISRARPNAFASEVLKSSTEIPADVYLPGFMGLHGPRGYSWNSFPSGHVSTCAAFLVLCYILSSSSNSRVRHSRFLVFIAVAIYSVAMAIARSMSGMHWLSDSVASFFLVWTVIDLLWIRFRSNIS